MFDVAVQILGFAAMALCIGSFQIKDSRRMILCQMFGNFLFVIQFLLLGAYAGCATLVFGVLSSLFIALQKYSWAEWRGWRWVYVVLTTGACLLTWSGPRDAFVLIGQVAFVLTTWTGNGRIIRIGKLTVVAPPWIIYNLLVHSYGGVISEMFGVLSTLISIRRYGWKALDESF